jgi:hypothetical protein
MASRFLPGTAVQVVCTARKLWHEDAVENGERSFILENERENLNCERYVGATRVF